MTSAVARAQARGGRRRLTAGMAAADHDDIERCPAWPQLLARLWTRLKGKILSVFHVKQARLLMVLRSELNPHPDEPHSGISKDARELRARPA